MHFKYNDNRGFTIIELMIVVVIISFFGISVLDLSTAGIISSDKRNMNDEYKYSKLFIDDLNIPKISVIPKDETEENEYNGFNKGYEKNSEVVYDIPYLDVHRTFDQDGMSLVNISKNNVLFPLKLNDNKTSSNFVYGSGGQNELSNLINKVGGVILLKYDKYTEDNITYDYELNDERGTDVYIRGKTDGVNIFSYIYNSSLGRYEGKSDIPGAVINPSYGTHINSNLLKVGYIMSSDAIMPSGTFLPGDPIDDKNYKIFNIKTLGVWKKCIVETPIGNSNFLGNIVPRIIKLDLYGKTFNFDSDSGTSKTDLCDYNIIFPVITRK